MTNARERFARCEKYAKWRVGNDYAGGWCLQHFLGHKLHMTGCRPAADVRSDARGRCLHVHDVKPVHRRKPKHARDLESQREGR